MKKKNTHTHLFRDERNFLQNVSIIKVKIISMRVCVKKGGVWWWHFQWIRFLVSLSAAVNQLWWCYSLYESVEKCRLLRVKHAEEHGKFSLFSLTYGCLLSSYGTHVDWECLTVHLCMTCWMACDELYVQRIGLFFLFKTRLLKNKNDTIQVRNKFNWKSLSEFFFFQCVRLRALKYIYICLCIFF